MLTIRNLSKTYDDGVRALNDVHLEIPRGLFGLLGPNGAGKSTLMRTLATLQGVDSGTLRFDGLDMLADPEAVRRRLGYLPQDFGVYPSLSAEAMLDHLAALKGIADRSERREAVTSLLRMTHLHDVRRRKLGTFSGGMRRRFGIAQALLGNPDLLIVDEPTAGLDPEERRRFQNLLSEIGENVVVILSTHIVEDVRELCSLVAVLSKGEVLLCGEPGTLIAGLQGKVWQKSVRRSEAAEYQERMTILSTRLSAGRVVVHVLADQRPADGFAAVEPDLEDVYFSALRGAPVH